MIIRKAIPSDFASMAQIAVSAMTDDIMDAYLYPYRQKHPAAYLATYTSQYRKFLSQKDSYIMIAELEPSDTAWEGSVEVVGYVEWYKREDESEKSFGKKFIEGNENP